MAEKPQRVQVELHFDGMAYVDVPAHLSKKDAKLLAGKIALARILATFDNPDVPEGDAFEEYEEEASSKGQKTADKDWDATLTEGLVGEWRGWPVEPPAQAKNQ